MNSSTLFTIQYNDQKVICINTSIYDSLDLLSFQKIGTTYSAYMVNWWQYIVL